MDCDTGDTDNTDNAAQLTTAMDPSTQAHQLSPPSSVDRLAWRNLMQEDDSLYVGSVSDAEKRDYDSSFHPSPIRSAKRLCSRLPMHLVPDGNNDGDTLDNSSGKTEDVIEDDSTPTAHMPSETMQTSPTSSLDPLLLQGAPVADITPNITHHDSIEQIEHSRNEISKHIINIKHNTPDCQIDYHTAMMLVNELEDLMIAERSVPAEELNQMRCNVAKFYRVVTSPNEAEAGQETLQTAPPSISSNSEFKPIPSDIYSIPPSPEAAVSSPQLENRCTQTEETTANTENDASVSPDACYSALSDTEAWKRELESIRRSQPLVDGSYTTVNLPLRVSASQPASISRGSLVSTQRGLKSNFDLISKLKSAPGPALQSGAIANGSRGNQNSDVISVHDTSDDEGEGMRGRATHGVGGGGPIWRMSEVQYGASDENETNLYGRHFQHGLQIDGTKDAIDDSSNHGDYDVDESIQEEVTNSSDDGRSYQDEKSDDFLFVSENSYESYGPENRDQPRTTTYGRTTITDRVATVDRERSRSPGYRLTRSVKKTPYREERHYQTHERYQSPTQVHRQKQCNTGPADEEGNSGFARDRRYMRDTPESPLFYGYSSKWSPKQERTLRYQDRINNVGEIPGPKSSLRLDLDGYVKNTGINNDALGLERAIESVHEKTFYAGETLDEEQALRSSWDNKPTTLYKGFPLVEDIGFVALGNHAKPEGDCYWRALAYILYGQPTRWDLIKADHQTFLRHVLSDKTHPRHELYAKLNTQFFETHGAVLINGFFGVTSAIKANLWQLLHMPHAWTPGVMQQVTADLYNIHLVTFEYNKHANMCSDVSIRGAYNSRHVFMLFVDDCHFQPLAVNEYLGWEFRYPRLTVAATARFPNAPKADSKKVKQAIQHPWRNDWTKEVPPPVPRNHGCDLFQLKKYMTIPRRASIQPRR